MAVKGTKWYGIRDHSVCGVSTRFKPGRRVAPDDKRCQYIKNDGTRCEQWSARVASKKDRAAVHVVGLKRHEMCTYHMKPGRGRKTYVPSKGTHDMRYSRYLKPALNRTLEEMLAEPVDRQLDLQEELALVRDVAGQAVSTYADARELVEAQPDNAKARDAMNVASMIMRDALREVMSTVETIVRVQGAGRDKVPAQFLALFVDQVVNCAYKAFGHLELPAPGEHDPIQEFAKLVRTQIRMPSDIDGTTLTPDLDVQQMDETVPLVEHEDAA